ncbi:MAG: ATP-dependent DNA helicase RecG [Candidatus Andersenbacteria bacterium]
MSVTLTQRVVPSDPVSRLHGVGPAAVRELQTLGIRTVQELAEHLPRRHEHYGRPVSIGSIGIPTGANGQPVLICAQVVSITNRRSFRRRLTIQEGLLNDETGSLAVTWFNQPYLVEALAGKIAFLRGKISRYKGRLTLESPEVVRDPAIALGKGALQPIYPLTGRITTKQMRYWIKQALQTVQHTPDVVPPSVRKRYDLLDRSLALTQLHFPGSNPEALDRARLRMTFEELFLLSLFVLRERASLIQVQARPTPVVPELLQEFVAKLPYTLTDAQRKAAWQIVQDLAKPHPMNRLLEGDVGSGKTVVAAMALLAVARSGGQAAVLAPTVILAEQHYTTLTTLLKPFGITVALLVSSSAETVALKKQLAAGTLSVVVGTHAILQPRVTFKQLHLVVVDEQHRFGVKQRQLLKTKVRLPNHLPHLLSMTATPIPRSLALTLYGDLDLSVLDQKPKRRAPITTKIVPKKAHTTLLKTIKKTVAGGQQVFVMFPLIEASDKLQARAVLAEYAELQKQLGSAPQPIRVGLLHGRMSDQEKNQVIGDFRAGRYQVLATTPVIEVGIDIPNATLMVVLSADRFGLAQLHQIRGRVGRGSKASLCLLVPDAATPETRKRLQLLCTTNDGFRLAEADLELRGPGEPFGTRQHGQVSFKFATVLDSRILAQAKEAAVAVLQADPSLRQWPLLKQRVGRVATQLHLE